MPCNNPLLSKAIGSPHQYGCRQPLVHRGGQRLKGARHRAQLLEERLCEDDGRPGGSRHLLDFGDPCTDLPRHSPRQRAVALMTKTGESMDKMNREADENGLVLFQCIC